MIPPLNQQVVVITGASSGVGREAALKFGEAGAKVVLAARNETALEEVATLIRNMGSDAMVVPTDVSDWQAVERLAQQSVSVFGRIDTWVNDAGVSVYGLIEEIPVEEIEKVVQVNLLGTIYGVKAVLPVMRRQGYGTIINIGSVLSERAIPLQAPYCATKFGVRGFTDGLRLELAAQEADIHVTLILPSSMNTPFFEHARSHMDSEPMPIAPVYNPILAADAILYAATHHKRNIYVGGASKLFTLAERISPSLSDRVMLIGNWVAKFQKDKKPNDGYDTFDAPDSMNGKTHGNFAQMTKPSMYTRLIEFAPAWLMAIPAMLIGSLILVKRR